MIQHWFLLHVLKQAYRGHQKPVELLHSCAAALFPFGGFLPAMTSLL